MGILIAIITSVIAGFIVYKITKDKPKSEAEKTEGETVKVSGENVHITLFAGLPKVPSGFKDKKEASYIETSVVNKYGNLIDKYASKHNLCGAVLAGLIYAESSGLAEAKSADKNSLGLMQIKYTKGALDDYIKEFGGSYSKDELLIPENNIKIGTWYLRTLINYAEKLDIVNRIEQHNIKDAQVLNKGHILNSSLYHALRAYNGGWGNVFGIQGKTNYIDGIHISANYANKIINYAWQLAVYEADKAASATVRNTILRGIFRV